MQILFLCPNALDFSSRLNPIKKRMKPPMSRTKKTIIVLNLAITIIVGAIVLSLIPENIESSTKSKISRHISDYNMVDALLREQENVNLIKEVLPSSRGLSRERGGVSWFIVPDDTIHIREVIPELIPFFRTRRALQITGYKSGQINFIIKNHRKRNGEIDYEKCKYCEHSMPLFHSHHLTKGSELPGVKDDEILYNTKIMDFNYYLIAVRSIVKFK